MTPALSYDELRAGLASASTPTERHVFFAAMLRVAAEVPDSNFFVVGGSAIEVYTVGRYSSGDIDIVCADARAVETVLRQWRFKREARVWVHEELGIVVDLVKPPYTGSPTRTTLVTTPFGPVRLAAIEDLLVKRLSSYRHWEAKEDIEHAKLLAVQFADRLDWDYIEEFAKDHRVVDLARSLRRAVLGK